MGTLLRYRLLKIQFIWELLFSQDWKKKKKKNYWGILNLIDQNEKSQIYGAKTKPQTLRIKV